MADSPSAPRLRPVPVTPIPDLTVTWQVKALLTRHRLSSYQLQNALRGHLSQPAVSRIVSGRSVRIDLRTLDVLLAALRALTGNADLQVGDLLRAEETLPGTARGPEDRK